MGILKNFFTVQGNIVMLSEYHMDAKYIIDNPGSIKWITYSTAMAVLDASGASKRLLNKTEIGYNPNLKISFYSDDSTILGIKNFVLYQYNNNMYVYNPIDYNQLLSVIEDRLGEHIEVFTSGGITYLDL